MKETSMLPVDVGDGDQPVIFFSPLVSELGASNKANLTI